MYWWKSWDQKHVDRNSILECQIWSVMIFDIDKSQRKECVTTSDWKTELVAITLKPCEACHSVLMYWSVKYISIHKRQYLLRASKKCNQVPKKLQMHFLVWCRCSGSPSSLPKQFPWVLRQPKQFVLCISASDSLPSGFPCGTVCSQDFHSRQFTLGISACNSLPLEFLLRTVCPWDICMGQFALGIFSWHSLPSGFLLGQSEQFAKELGQLKQFA